MFKELLEQIKLFLFSLDVSEIFGLVCAAMIIILMLSRKFFRRVYNKFLGKVERYIKPLADEAVKRSAEYFNSESGQIKMKRAVQYVQEMTITAPWYIRIFTRGINEVWLIDRIEDAYQAYKLCMDSNIPDEKLDIKGNEVKKK